MQQTPEIPDGCQWAIFLRNHDELTLEMVTSKERDYMYTHVRRRPARAHQPGHPPPPGAADGKRHRPHQADEQHAAVDARLADHLLRRRDRHGRQRVRRRPQRRAHADAVEPRPQRRLLARRPAAPVPAADHGPDVRLRGAQRRGAVARARLAANWTQRMLAVRKTSRAFGRGKRTLPEARQPQGAGLPPRARRRRRSCAVFNLSRSAQPVELDLSAYKGRVPVEMLGPHRVPADRRPALPADAALARLLLVPARRPT